MAERYVSFPKTLGERVKAALERRLFPKTNLTRKQLQHTLHISTGTMDNLLNGHHDPSGRVLDLLVAYFRDSFVNEIWEAHNIHCIDTMAERRADALRRIADAQAELREIG